MNLSFADRSKGRIELKRWTYVVLTLHANSQESFIEKNLGGKPLHDVREEVLSLKAPFECLQSTTLTLQEAFAQCYIRSERMRYLFVACVRNPRGIEKSMRISAKCQPAQARPELSLTALQITSQIQCSAREPFNGPWQCHQ